MSLVARALLTASCTRDYENAPEELILSTGTASQPSAVGVRLVNPYSLQTMREALNELSSLKKSSISEIKATHLYVRFVPKDSAEYAEIDKDTTIFYYSYPLDYDLEESELDAFQQGRVYPYEYCVFKIGQKIPDVEYEILDSCFILEEANVYDDDENLSKASVETSPDWKELEARALEIAGIDNSEACTSKKWSPSCTLNYWDDTKNSSVPLEGVPVRCRNNIMISHQCCTDSKGLATFSKMNGKADYLIHWKRADFKLRPGEEIDEVKTILKKNVKKPESFTFYKTTGDFQNAWKYASVFRAVHHYYYKDIDGLSRPGCSNLTIRISDKDEDVYGSAGRHFVSSDIHIYDLSRSSKEIYGTTIHEMAHIAHRFSIYKGGLLFSKVKDEVVESWAVGVQNYLTSKIYSGYERGYYTKEYTNIVTNLINGTDKDGNVIIQTPYTIADIEKSLIYVKSWNSWMNSVKLINKGNEEYIEVLYDSWAN